MEIKLYRFPRLRPPVIGGRPIESYGKIVMQIIERPPPIELTPHCFLKNLHEIPRVH